LVLHYLLNSLDIKKDKKKFYIEFST